jgi:hypothetical protein
VYRSFVSTRASVDIWVCDWKKIYM